MLKIQHNSKYSVFVNYSVPNSRKVGKAKNLNNFCYFAANTTKPYSTLVTSLLSIYVITTRCTLSDDNIIRKTVSVIQSSTYNPHLLYDFLLRHVNIGTIFTLSPLSPPSPPSPHERSFLPCEDWPYHPHPHPHPHLQHLQSQVNPSHQNSPFPISPDHPHPP